MQCYQHSEEGDEDVDWPGLLDLVRLFTEKEKERLDQWNPTLVFEYEKSRDSVGTNFRCGQREEYF